MSAGRPLRILPIIVLAQLACTSLWFAGNAILESLQADLGIEGDVSLITSAVQLGFIVGSAVLTMSGFGDRFSTSRVFFMGALVGASANVAVIGATSLQDVVALRFLVGVSLAAIYPMGMKAAASWYKEGLGGALGWLVGALVLGTALPHLASGFLPWRETLVGVSLLALAGGFAVLILVPEGPHTRVSTFRAGAVVELLRLRSFRSAALGYFGHMWELYTFWAFTPALILVRNARHAELPVSETSFVVIAAGAIGCIGGGFAARRFGSRRVAMFMLAVSGTCCLLLPWAIDWPTPLFIVFILTWGVAVVGDSPQFSAITARSTPAHLVGTGLSLVTSVGFALTIASVYLAQLLDDPVMALSALAVGPAIAFFVLRCDASER
ncbi:MAG: MFS family permease [Polyangiales bacterium]|jgi:MFS family permease